MAEPRRVGRRRVGGAVEGRGFERAEGAVPDEGRRAVHGLGDVEHAVGAGVEDHGLLGAVLGAYDLERGAFAKVFGHHHVAGEDHLAAGFRGLLGDGAGGVGHVVLAERAAHVEALRGEEGVGHGAADDEDVDLLDQVREQVDLGRDLGAADDGHQRPVGVAEGGFQRLEFRLHQPAGAGGQEAGQRLGRGMRPMGGGEGIVAVDVAQGGDAAGEVFVVGLFAGVEADVLQQQHLGGAGLLGEVLGAVEGFDELDRVAEGVFQRGDELAQGHAVDDLALGPAEMRQQHGLAALVEDGLHGGHDPVDARGVGDLSVFHRHVDVDPGQDRLAVEVHIVEGFPAHGPPSLSVGRNSRPYWRLAAGASTSAARG